LPIKDPKSRREYERQRWKGVSEERRIKLLLRGRQRRLLQREKIKHDRLDDAALEWLERMDAMKWERESRGTCSLAAWEGTGSLL
jgi:hypothetical protein